jgi:GTP-binding protein
VSANELPMVAIVGRPNVGKSTLLNRFVGRREAIVEEKPGVTRDRKVVAAEWQGREFRLVDTGGWMPGGVGDSLDAKVSKQSEQAMNEADVILLVVDATVGITEDDARVSEVLRQAKKPVLVVVNKVDDANREAAIWEFMALGLGEPMPVSALHGRAAGDLLDHVMELLPPFVPTETVPSDEQNEHAQGEIDEQGRRVFAVAIVGRPNVGKSTLFNRLIGEERAVVHDMPGTTRDTIDTVVETPSGPIRFVDTAGMRRRSRIDEGTEYYSLVRALQAVDRSDVAVLVIDSTEGVTAQDQRLTERIDAAGCPVVILLNKIELLDTDARAALAIEVERKLHFIGEAVVLRMSALTGKGVQKLVPVLADAIESYHTRIPTRKVNDVIRDAQLAQPAPHGARVMYALQGAADPPTFTLFATKELPPTYLRYLERRLREAFSLGATPIKLRVRNRAD